MATSRSGGAGVDATSARGQSQGALLELLLSDTELEALAPASAAVVSHSQIIEQQAQTIARLEKQAAKSRAYKALTKLKLKEAAALLREYRLRVEALGAEVAQLRAADAALKKKEEVEAKGVPTSGGGRGRGRGVSIRGRGRGRGRGRASEERVAAAGDVVMTTSRQERVDDVVMAEVRDVARAVLAPVRTRAAEATEKASLPEAAEKARGASQSSSIRKMAAVTDDPIGDAIDDELASISDSDTPVAELPVAAATVVTLVPVHDDPIGDAIDDALASRSDEEMTEKDAPAASGAKPLAMTNDRIGSERVGEQASSTSRDVLAKQAPPMSAATLSRKRDDPIGDAIDDELASSSDEDEVEKSPPAPQFIGDAVDSVLKSSPKRESPGKLLPERDPISDAIDDELASSSDEDMPAKEGLPVAEEKPPSEHNDPIGDAIDDELASSSDEDASVKRSAAVATEGLPTGFGALINDTIVKKAASTSVEAASTETESAASIDILPPPSDHGDPIGAAIDDDLASSSDEVDFTVEAPLKSTRTDAIGVAVDAELESSSDSDSDSDDESDESDEETSAAVDPVVQVQASPARTLTTEVTSAGAGVTQALENQVDKLDDAHATARAEGKSETFDASQTSAVVNSDDTTGRTSDSDDVSQVSLLVRVLASASGSLEQAGSNEETKASAQEECVLDDEFEPLNLKRPRAEPALSSLEDGVVEADATSSRPSPKKVKLNKEIAKQQAEETAGTKVTQVVRKAPSVPEDPHVKPLAAIKRMLAFKKATPDDTAKQIFVVQTITALLRTIAKSYESDPILVVRATHAVLCVFL